MNPERKLREEFLMRVGDEIPTPSGLARLIRLDNETDEAYVLLDHAVEVAFPIQDLIGIDTELCAVCQNFAVSWSSVCARPVCYAHRIHGAPSDETTAYQVAKVLSRLRRHGIATVIDPGIARTIAHDAARHGRGTVRAEPLGPRRHGVRLVLAPPSGG